MSNAGQQPEIFDGGRLVEIDGVLPCPFCGYLPRVLYIPPHEHKATGVLTMPPFQGAYYIECLECDFALSDYEMLDLRTRWNVRMSYA